MSFCPVVGLIGSYFLIELNWTGYRFLILSVMHWNLQGLTIILQSLKIMFCHLPLCLFLSHFILVWRNEAFQFCDTSLLIIICACAIYIPYGWLCSLHIPFPESLLGPFPTTALSSCVSAVIKRAFSFFFFFAKKVAASGSPVTSCANLSVSYAPLSFLLE